MSSNNPSCLNTSIVGASVENIIRQPLTAATVVMINENKSLGEATLALYRNGGIKRFYNGIQGFGISWLMRSTHRVATFETNQRMNEAGYSNAAISVATTVAEVATTSIGELILTLAQSQKKDKQILDLIKTRYREGGFSSFTTGFIGNCGRNIIFNAALFGLKNKYDSQVKANPIAMSAFISLNAVVLSHPIEILRTKKVKTPEFSYYDLGRKTYSEIGIGGFGQGLLPRILSVGAGTFTMMAIFTILQNTNR